MPVVPLARRLGAVLVATLLSPLALGQTATFEPLGGPEAGFVSSILVQDDGGVLISTRDSFTSGFRSSDGGATWTYDDNLPSGFYTGFAQLPNGDLIAASSSNVYRSTDGGASWASTENGYNIRSIIDFAHDGESRLYASSYYTGAVRSLDGGQTWEAASTGLDTLRASAVTVAASGRVWLAGYGGRIHVSDDQGSSWTPAYDGFPNTYTRDLLAPSGGRVLATTNAGLFRINADATAWERVRSGLGVDSTRSFLSLAELPGGRLLAATYHSIYVSDDGGETWGARTPADRPIGAYALAVTNDGVVYGGSIGGGISRSDDGGETWSSSTAGFVNPDVSALLLDADGGLLVGTSRSQTPNAQRWDPATRTWSALETIRDGSVVAWLRSANGALLAGASGGLLRSVDNGATWTRSTVLNRFVYSLAEAPGDTLYAGTHTGVARSTDDGVTWDLLTAPAGRVVALAAAPDGTVYAGLQIFGASDVETGLMRSTDGGETWTYINGWSDTPRNVNPNGLAVDASGNLLVTFNFYGFYRSGDRGETWTEIVGLPRYAQVLHTTEDVVLAAHNDGSIYRTSDGGASWAAVTAEPSGLYPRAIEVADDGTIYLGTWGRGVYRTASVSGTADEDDARPRGGLALRSYPTPFTSATTVEVTLPEAGTIRADVFDALGRRVATTAEGARAPGTHQLRLDGASWPAGLYIVRVTAGERAETVRVVKAR